MTVPEFQRQKSKGRKLVVVTAYDALFTRILEQAGIEAILVGDSLGVVVQGKSNTLSVTMDEMIYHTMLVASVRENALVIADMPFMSYQVSVEEAVRNAGRLIQAGAGAVKLEGGISMIDRVQALTQVGIPVMGHIGMTPQSVNQYGGYKVQGREDVHAEALLADARALESAGAFSLVLEAIPVDLAKSITEAVSIPTIGIGAGPNCDGQVLVLYDLLGLFDEFSPKFVKPYAHLKADALQALRRFKEEVECQKFPSDLESYH
ncbi:3-methyl-2-oxobutanoate hydroxymethyltransferase [Candidatus Nitronereus thalassa]|uniref:3-methyl-2-oxobutanoate hydroxymethyltransferase n=1 Tax=Candidatus Nitronereus thalassa TaxID=3020898 RepID=A0ABU3K7F1_9BACT|nr:3-methyl-2-oxobutanoate hydroxymethyltransferase [Candidatus Nitronereus thalassa]MDT7042319.1 3-methyl-2-oxobutanoate hydroxymethyltransferase [Candidatus Nitronereus thalassa]